MLFNTANYPRANLEFRKDVSNYVPQSLSLPKLHHFSSKLILSSFPLNKKAYNIRNLNKEIFYHLNVTEL